jgi:hypothetical protein
MRALFFWKGRQLEDPNVETKHLTKHFPQVATTIDFLELES